MLNDESKKRLVLLELNEINFDVVKFYIDIKPSKFPSLKKLMNGFGIRTMAEDNYENLEPWIQWVSLHTGLSFTEHGIFRLGDIVGSNKPQLFEYLEQRGINVGCISAMNTENRLTNPAYFIPDPWTKTRTDGSFWSEILAQAVSQTVNDNAQSKITIKSAFFLFLATMRFAKFRHYKLYLKLALYSSGASWRKALFLDLLLHDLHLGWLRARKPCISTLFLNAGAHIQHHYFFNAAPIKATNNLRNPSWYISDKEDPFADMLEVYDAIIYDYLALNEADVVIATGLAQKPYDRIKYYYRLKDHAEFLNSVGINFCRVMPRMTRDFLIEFSSSEQAAAAEIKLRKMLIMSDKEPLFGAIDNRGNSLFVTLTYPNEISEETMLELDGVIIPISNYTTFVAIKNGMHQGEGFAFFTPGVAKFAPRDHSHVKEIHGTIINFFGFKN
jgi:hypothetical protein